MEILTIHTDGGARGNPGPSGIGITIENEKGETLQEISEYIGAGTNNVAEYTAVIRALKAATLLYPQSASVVLNFYLDSQLVARQLEGVYKVKDANLKILAREAHELMERFHKVSFTHVMREENARADELANEAMDKGA